MGILGSAFGIRQASFGWLTDHASRPNLFCLSLCQILPPPASCRQIIDITKSLNLNLFPVGGPHGSALVRCSMKEILRYYLNPYGDTIFLSPVMHKKLYFKRKNCDIFMWKVPWILLKYLEKALKMPWKKQTFFTRHPVKIPVQTWTGTFFFYFDL